MAMSMVLGCSTSTMTMAIVIVSVPSVLSLAPFSSREAALSKRRAHKRTRIDKEKKNKKMKGALRPLITGEGRLGVVGISRPPQKPKFHYVWNLGFFSNSKKKELIALKNIL